MSVLRLLIRRALQLGDVALAGRLARSHGHEQQALAQAREELERILGGPPRPDYLTYRPPGAQDPERAGGPAARPPSSPAHPPAAAARPTPAPARGPERPALEELAELVGLTEVKAKVKSIVQFVRHQQRRRTRGLKDTGVTLHMVFTGNPGTGKTTVARLMGRAFREQGVLRQGHLVEVARADLVGEYVGQTAQKTMARIEEARGGMLFIDEAYSLTRNQQGNDFGIEAVDTLIKAMEDHRSDLVVVVAGYSREMAEFITANSGMFSRFQHYVHFPDYTPEELLAIFRLMLKQRQYQLSPAAEARVKDVLARCDISLGNARLARDLMEESILRLALRVADIPEAQLDEDDDILLEETDIPPDFKYVVS